MPPEPSRPRSWLPLAGALHVVGLLLVATSLVRLDSITLMLSVGVGGGLLLISWGIYAATVVLDLRSRRIL